MDGKFLPNQSATNHADFMFDLQRFANTWTLTKDSNSNLKLTNGSTTYTATAGQIIATAVTGDASDTTKTKLAAGDTIQLGGNISLSSEILTFNSGIALTLDLKGFTLSNTDNRSILIGYQGNDYNKTSVVGNKLTIIGNGTISGYYGIAVMGGLIENNTARDGTALSPTAGYSESNPYSTLILGSEDGSSNITVTDTSGWAAIWGNGNIFNFGTDITINKGVTLNCEGGRGIYHPQYGKLTINGATIKGKSTGIEFRGGELTVNEGSTIESTQVLQNANLSYQPNGNGSTTDGAGIAIAQHDTMRNISLNINGGTISGYTALSVANPQNNAGFGEATTRKTHDSSVLTGELKSDGKRGVGTVEVNVNGGTLKSTSTATSDTVTKNGDKYTITGKNAIINSDSRVTVNIENATIEDGSIASTSRAASTDNGQNTTGYNIKSGNTFKSFTYDQNDNVGLISYYQVKDNENNPTITLNVVGGQGWAKDNTTENQWLYRVKGATDTATTVATLAPKSGADKILQPTTSGTDARTIRVDLTEEVFSDLADAEFTTLDASGVTDGKFTLDLKGNDKITKITGGSGADTLTADINDATLEGGNGADIFVLSKDSVKISDYNATTDNDAIQVSESVEVSGVANSKIINFGDKAVEFTNLTDNNSVKTVKVKVGDANAKEYKLAAQIDDKTYTLADARTKGATIKLLEDVANLTIAKSEDVAIDLNGHKLTGNITVNGNLTLSDSATEKGEVSGAIEVKSGGTFNLESGSIKQTVTNGGTFNMTGGTIEPTTGSGIINNGTLNLRGGKINSTNGRGVNNATANSYFNMFSGSVFGKVGIKMFAGFLKLLGGRVHGRGTTQNGEQSVVENDLTGEPVTYNAEAEETNSGVGIDVANNGSAEVTVGDKNNKGDIQVSGETTALEISGSGTSTVNLNDGKYTAGQADDDGNITSVNSNYNSIKYNSSNNANKLTVDGAILESKVDTGSANVGGSDTATDGTANQIVINSVAVAPDAKKASQNNGKDTAFTKLLTTTANFNGKNDYAFAGTASDFFAVKISPSSSQNVPEQVGVVEYLDASDNVVQDGETAYGSFKDAVAALKDNDTLTLLKALSVDEQVAISVNASINFNGFNLTYSKTDTDKNAAISLGSGKSLSLSSGDNLVNGGIQVTNSSYTIKSGTEDFDRLRLTTSGTDSVFFYNFDSAMNRLDASETLTYAKAVDNFTTLSYNKDDKKEFRIESLSSSNGISITGGDSKNISLTTSNFSNASVASGGTNYTFYLSGDATNQSFTGSAGNDKIVNASKQLAVFGGAGNDSITNSGESATIDGGEGDDTITNTGANASLFGGDGNDSIVNNKATTGGVTLNGGAGDDYLQGNSTQADTFIYSGGADSIASTGYGDDDTVSLEGFSPITDGLKLASLGASKFALNFGTGDSLTFNVASASIMSGSGTASTYVYTPTAISLKGSSNNDSVTLGASYDFDSFDGSSTFTHIVATAVQTLPSGKEYFSIKGGSSANYIVGSDYVATSIMGGTGNDTLKAGAKAAVLNGGTGGSDTFIGGAGADSIIASGASAYINGGLGENLITLNGSNNATIDATAGTDLISIGGSSVTTLSLKGFSENDTLQFSSAVKDIGAITGGISLKAGSDTVTVQGFPTGGTLQSWSFNNDVASYAAVKSEVSGTNAWTYVGGESEAITFNGTTKTTGSNLFAIKGLANTDGSSVDTISKVVSLSASNFGADGVSVVSNSGYAFSLTGGDYSGKTFAGSGGVDTIYNGISNIYINGGNGGDRLENVSGENVTLAGGAGNDTLVGSSGKAETFVYNGEGNDSIGGYSAGDIIMTTLTPITNVSKFTGSNNNYVFNFGSNSSLAVASAEGVPVSVRKSGETDTYAYTANKVSKNGTAVTLTAAVGTTKYTAADTETSIDASAVTVSTTIEGNAKDNYIIGSSTKAGSLLGGVGGDSLYAGRMGAYLDGGDDGNDLLVGADGVDTFVYRGGKDTIQAYSSSDIVKVEGDSFTPPTTFTATTTPSLSYDNSNYVLNFDTGNSLTFQAKNSFSIVKGNDTYSYEIDSIALNNTIDNKHGITLGGAHHTSKTFRGDSTANSAYVTINASEVDHVITVRGNDNANLIHGGSKGGTLLGGNENDTLVAGAVGTYLNGGDENDSLVGGNGNDTFAYTSGNDTIKSYTQDVDLVSVASSIDIASATVNTAGSGTPANLVIAFDDAGSLTFEEGASSTISLKSGKKYYTFSASSIASAADKSITLTANFNSSPFDAGEDYNNIDASAVSLTSGISIKGNDNGNYIIGSASQASSLVGGKGDDTFKGGAGNDVFFYEAGKDVIIGFNEGTNNTDRLSIDTGDIAKAKASSRKLTFTMSNKANTLVFRATDAAPTQISLSSNEGYLTKDGVVSLPSSTKSLKLFSSAKGRIDLNNDTLYSDKGIASVSAAEVAKQSVTLVGGSSGGTFTFANGNKKRDGFEYNGGEVTIGNYESGKDRLNLGEFAISGFEVKEKQGQTAGDVVISLGSGDQNVISLTGAAGSEMLIHQSTNRGNSYSKMVFSETGVVYDKAKAKATSATIWGGLETTTKHGYSAKDDEATKLKKIKVRDEAVTSISIQAGGNNTLIDASLAGAGVSLYSGAKNDKFIGSSYDDMFVYTKGKDIIQGFGDGDSISLSGGTELALTDAKITSGKKSIKFKFEGGSKNTLTIKPTKNDTLSGALNINGEERIYGKNFIASGTNVSLTSKFGGTYNLDKVNKNASGSYNYVDGHLVEKKLTFKGTDAAESLVGGQNKTTFKGGGGADSLVGGKGADTFFYAKGDKYTVTIANFDFDNDKLKIAGGTINKIESLEGSDGGIQFAMKNGRGDSPAVGWFKLTSSATSTNYDENGKATSTGTAIAAKDVLIKANNTYYWFAQDTITQEVTTAGGDGSTITVASAGDLITWDKKISASQAKNTNCDIIELNYSTNLVKAGVASVVSSSSNALPTK